MTSRVLHQISRDLFRLEQDIINEPDRQLQLATQKLRDMIESGDSAKAPRALRLFRVIQKRREGVVPESSSLKGVDLFTT